MLSRRTLRRLRHMRARQDRYDEQHDSEEEDFISLLPDMLDELEEERRKSKVFRVQDGAILDSQENPDDGENALNETGDDSTTDASSRQSFLDMLRTPTEVFGFQVCRRFFGESPSWVSNGLSACLI